ncbi:tetratricopeptide repeat protein [Okeania sp. SIO1I7]|uniref:tetratricopeptide repeat protein n=1 Tax=Okeania sp. SIO1I7 TaxID=2607772 RepID=UPI0013FB485B|nr:tetratricopeptide repeat protein [Okeania sp. SIO1I7]NET26737.1 tetratricopeptide repeat protein [Okeania sp. SIO1I7]
MGSTAIHSTKLKQLSQTGDRLFDLGQFEIALNTFQEALKIVLTSEQQINILNRIGLVYRGLEKYDCALKYLNLALQLAQEIGDQNLVVMILNDIGETYCLSIEYTSALRYYAQALEIAQYFSNLLGIGIILNHLGEIYNLLGLFEKTLNCCQKSLEIFHKLERKSELDKLACQINIATALSNIGEAYLWMGRYTQAKEILELTVAIRQKICKVTLNKFSQTPDSLDKNILHNNYPNSKKSSQTNQLLQQEKICLSQSIICQHGADLANTMNLIEKVYRHIGQLQKAEKYRQQKLEIWETCGEKYVIYNTYILPFYLRFSCHYA